MGWLDDPDNRALLAGFGGGLLGSTAPSPYRVGLPAALGAGVQTGLQAQGESARNRLLATQAKIQEAQLPFALAQAQAMQRYLQQNGMQGSGGPQTGASFNLSDEGTSGPGAPRVDPSLMASSPAGQASAPSARASTDRRALLLDQANAILSDPILRINPDMVKAASGLREEAYRGLPTGMEPGGAGAAMIPGVIPGTAAMETTKALANNLFTVTPDGRVVPIAGAPEATGAVEGAKARATAAATYPYEVGKIQESGAQTRQTQGSEVIPVTLPNGQTQFMPKADAAGGTPNATPGAAGSTATPAAILDAIEHQESSGGQNLFGRDSTGKVKAIGPYQFTPDTLASAWNSGVQFNPMDRADARRGADWLMQQNLRATGGDVRKALAMYNTGDPNSSSGLAYADKVLGTAQQIGGRPTFGMSTQQQAAAKAHETAAVEQEKSASDEAAKQREDAASAEKGMANLTTLESALDNFRTGTTGPARLAAAKGILDTLQAAGFQPSDRLKSAVASGEVIKSSGAQLAFELVRSLGTREAASVVNQAMQVKPGLQMSDVGGKQIAALLKSGLQRELDRRQWNDDWFSRNGSHTGEASAFNDAHPVESYISRVVPLDPPKSSDKAKRDTVYNTPRGPMMWTGTGFVQVQ